MGKPKVILAKKHLKAKTPAYIVLAAGNEAGSKTYSHTQYQLTSSKEGNNSFMSFTDHSDSELS